MDTVVFRMEITLNKKHITIKQKNIKNNKNEKYPKTIYQSPYKNAKKAMYLNKFFILLIKVPQLFLKFHQPADMEKFYSFWRHMSK